MGRITWIAVGLVTPLEMIIILQNTQVCRRCCFSTLTVP